VPEQRPAHPHVSDRSAAGPAYPAYLDGAPSGAAAQPRYPAAGPVPVPVRARTSYGWVWEMIGILAVTFTGAVVAGVLFLSSGPETYGDDPRLDSLWESCDRGAMGACDRLYDDAPLFSEYEDFGLTCGRRSDFEMSCAQ
jgi:hypothetical protein